MKAAVLFLGATLAGAAVVVIDKNQAADELVLPVERKSPIQSKDKDGTKNPNKTEGLQALEQVESPPVATSSAEEPVEREPSAIRVSNNLFRAFTKPTPPPKPVVAAVVDVKPAPAPLKPPFVYLGSFSEDGESQAITQQGGVVTFLRKNQEVAGFRVESINERGMTMVDINSGQRALVQAQGTK